MSSYSTAKRLEVGSPGGPGRKSHESGVDPRRALADRIEDNLGVLLERTKEILSEERGRVLALAHALETHKTLTGDDVVAVLEGRPGPLVNGTAYGDEDLIRDLEAYHRAALAAHHGHTRLTLTLPEPAGNGNGNGSAPVETVEIAETPEPTETVERVGPSPWARPADSSA